MFKYIQQLKFLILGMDIQAEQIQKGVQQYYGQTLTSSESLQTNACCVAKSGLTLKQKKALTLLHEEISSKFYGCGSPIPSCIEGATIVDLGCGSGVDVYIASYFVRQSGKVIGIDMTPQQLQVAIRHKEQMAKRFQFSKTNVQFIQGRIEKIPLPDNSVDVVISNCVINLSPSKKQVFSEIQRILKNGGQLYFSDVFANLRINQELRNDKVLWGECLSGALYIQDFRRIMDQLGFKDIRVVSKSIITVNNPDVQKRVQGIKFYSITYRCFKLDDIEDRCEDYGQSATYLGGIDEFEQEFNLDNGHLFKKGVPSRVCGNTASMLKYSRFGKYFSIDQRGQHKGLFDCSGGNEAKQEMLCGGGSCC